MEEAMDSDDEMMFVALMEEEAIVASVADDEHLIIMLSCLMAMYARDGAKPRRGGLAPGRRKSKPRQRMEGYCILYVDDPLQGEVVF
jgi:hypothetical protein